MRRPEAGSSENKLREDGEAAGSSEEGTGFIYTRDRRMCLRFAEGHEAGEERGRTSLRTGDGCSGADHG